MRIQHYNEIEQKQRRFYETLKEANDLARKCGEEFEAVKAVDASYERFLGYTVERR